MLRRIDVGTAIAVYTSSGCVGRCDANCHQAQEPECDCICGGRNHGCGSYEQAVANNTAEALEAGTPEVVAWAERHGVTAQELRSLKVASIPALLL